MDKSAIEQIQVSAHIPDIIKQATGLVTQERTIILPAGFEVKSLDRYMPNPAFFEQTFVTGVTDDFVEYCRKHSDGVCMADGAACFIDEGEMSAKTVFDLGSASLPGHAFHKAVLQLPKTAEYIAMETVSGHCTDLNQLTLSDFLEDWKHNIDIIGSDKKEMSVDSACVAVRNIKIEEKRDSGHSVQDFGESRSAMESIEANKDKPLPSLINFSCNPFRSLPMRKFTMRVSILTGSKAPRFKLRVVCKEKHLEEMSCEFKELIDIMFKDIDIDTYIGKC